MGSNLVLRYMVVENTQNFLRTIIAMKSNIGILFLAIVGYSSAEHCYQDFSVTDLPQGVTSNIISLMMHEGFVKMDCSKIQVNVTAIQLLFWTRKNPDVPIVLTKDNNLDATKPTIVIIPGWVCNVTNNCSPEIRKAYLERYDCNVIGVDWTKYSFDIYGNAYCAVAGVAKIMAEFLCESNVDFNKLHIVGHSLGGQMAGLIGQIVQKLCNKTIDRITGLDPAGPLYQFSSESDRLDKNDAKSVDVIHTNGGAFGYLGSCGTTDFFPNCGKIQPGCSNVTLTVNLLNVPFKQIVCNHMRSLELMLESIKSDNLVGTSSKTAPVVCIGDLFHPTKAIMGESCPANNPDRKYILTTNSEPPYAQR